MSVKQLMQERFSEDWQHINKKKKIRTYRQASPVNTLWHESKVNARLKYLHYVLYWHLKLFNTRLLTSELFSCSIRSLENKIQKFSETLTSWLFTMLNYCSPAKTHMILHNIL